MPNILAAIHKSSLQPTTTIGRQTNAATDRETGRPTDRHRERQTDRQRDARTARRGVRFAVVFFFFCIFKIHNRDRQSDRARALSAAAAASAPAWARPKPESDPELKLCRGTSSALRSVQKMRLFSLTAAQQTHRGRESALCSCTLGQGGCILILKYN